jgi:hypothetical protein
MSFEAGERRAALLLSEVPLPVPFDIAEFSRRVAQHRGRPLALVPRPAGSMSEAVGLLVGFRDRDEIHYVSDTSVYHQQAIILHEIGHLMAEHPGGVHDRALPSSLLAGDWDPAVLQRLKSRHRYHDDEECEAEGFATAVLDQVDEQARRGRKSPAGPPAQARLASMFLR